MGSSSASNSRRNRTRGVPSSSWSSRARKALAPICSKLRTFAAGTMPRRCISSLYEVSLTCRSSLGFRTKVPRPTTRSITSSPTRASMACRTVIRARPKRTARSRSDGSADPGGQDSLMCGAEDFPELDVDGRAAAAGQSRPAMPCRVSSPRTAILLRSSHLKRRPIRLAGLDHPRREVAPPFTLAAAPEGYIGLEIPAGRRSGSRQDKGAPLPVHKAIVSAAIGLHARPAAEFVRAVTGHGSARHHQQGRQAGRRCPLPAGSHDRGLRLRLRGGAGGRRRRSRPRYGLADAEKALDGCSVPCWSQQRPS